MRKELPLAKVYQLLEPGPVVLVSTAYLGRHNIMTMSWQCMIDFEPPTFACVISNRNYSFELLKGSKECVINIPSVELVKKVVKIGSCSGLNIDKFTKFDLTPVRSSLVDAPLIDECFANLECKIADTKLVNKYNLFILEVVKAWIVPRRQRRKTIHHCGRGHFVVDGDTIKLPFNKK